MTAAVAIVACVAAGGALGHGTASSTGIVGNPTAGKALFLTTCAACHTLKAAGAVGTIGQNLDKVTLSEATIIAAITNGGASVMTKAALAKYPTQMVPYKGTLSTAQIEDIAAFEYSSTSAGAAATAKPSISSVTPASGKVGTKLTIAGANLTGATAVKIGALKAVFKAVSATKITATVPSKAKTGKVAVTTPGGTATSAKSFAVTS